MARLTDKVCIITGAARGMGARDRAGCSPAKVRPVIVADVLDGDGEALAAELGAGAQYVRLDVTEDTSWQALGGGHLVASWPDRCLGQQCGRG